MGEYVYTSIEIRGHIPSLEAFNDLVDALEGRDMNPNGDNTAGATREELVTAFAKALANGYSPTFCGETNYGNLDEIISVCQGYDIGYEHEYEAAGDGAAGTDVWYPGEKNHFSDDDTVIGANDLEKLLEAEDPVSAIRERIRFMRRASGSELPDMTAADEVRDHLAVEIGRAKVLAA